MLVDRLEVIEVQEEDRDLLVATCHGVLQAVAEEDPVGKSGEWVVERAALQLGLEHLALLERGSQVVHHAAEAGDHQQEEDDAAGGDHRDVDRLAAHPLDDEHRGCHQRGAGEEDEAPDREADIARLDRVGDVAHRRVEGCRAPEGGAEQPASVDQLPGLVGAAQRQEGVGALPWSGPGRARPSRPCRFGAGAALGRSPARDQPSLRRS